MIIDGKKIADDIIDDLKREIENSRLKLKIGVVIVGDNPVSLSYISQKERSCLRAGVGFSLVRFPLDIDKNELIRGISSISADGVLIQLPLPKEMDTQEILDAVSMEKDIDLLTTISSGKYYSGDISILPPTVGAIAHILGDISLRGKNVVVVGSGRLVGRPLAFWLMTQGATVSIMNSSTSDIKYFTKEADIVISGVGKAGLIKGDMIKKGAIVIDAGSSIEESCLKGDVDLKSVSEVASKVSPVPGGVGPVTTACLIQNLIKMKKRYGKIDL